MKIRTNGLFATLAAAVVLLGSAGLAQAAKGEKPSARGKVSKLDTSAKTFVVSSKKAGDTAVSYSDSTKFRKVGPEEDAKPVDATAADLKDGTRVTVRGALADGKVTATQIQIGGHKKKKAAGAAGTAATTKK